MESIEKDLVFESDITLKTRIVDLEKQVAILLDSVENLSESLRDTHRHLIMMSHNQKTLAKRVSTWPYIIVQDHKNEEGESF